MTLSWFAEAMNRIRPGNGALVLEQALPLDARHRLCLVRCEDRRVLLLVGGSRDLVVGWLDGAAAAVQDDPS